MSHIERIKREIINMKSPREIRDHMTLIQGTIRAIKEDPDSYWFDDFLAPEVREEIDLLEQEFEKLQRYVDDLERRRASA